MICPHCGQELTPDCDPEVLNEQWEKIKARAYEIDPDAWISYSGCTKKTKQYLDARRREALEKAEKELR